MMNVTYGFLVNAEDLLRQIPKAVENPKSIDLYDDMVEFYDVYRKRISFICKKLDVFESDYEIPEHLSSKEKVVSLSQEIFKLVMKLQWSVRFVNQIRRKGVLKRIQSILSGLNCTNGKYLNYLNYWEDLWAEEFEKYGRS